MLGTKSVHAVFVSPVVWLTRRPESKTVYFLVGPNEWPFKLLSFTQIQLRPPLCRCWMHTFSSWMWTVTRFKLIVEQFDLEVSHEAHVELVKLAYVYGVTRSFESPSHVLNFRDVIYIFFLLIMFYTALSKQQSCSKVCVIVKKIRIKREESETWSWFMVINMVSHCHFSFI